LNGLLAALFWTSALASPEEPLLNSIEVNHEVAFKSVGFSYLEFQKEIIGTEIQYINGHDFSYGPLQVISSVSATESGGIWVGSGFYNQIDLKKSAQIGFSFVPGIYFQGEEVDLGGWLMFRSGVELIFPIGQSNSISFSYDHRSSGDIWPYNPGLETWQIRFRTYM
jgi:hypothetical protein